MKPTRFLQRSDATKSVNRELEETARALPGIKDEGEPDRLPGRRPGHLEAR